MENQCYLCSCHDSKMILRGRRIRQLCHFFRDSAPRYGIRDYPNSACTEGFLAACLREPEMCFAPRTAARRQSEVAVIYRGWAHVPSPLPHQMATLLISIEKTHMKITLLPSSCLRGPRCLHAASRHPPDASRCSPDAAFQAMITQPR